MSKKTRSQLTLPELNFVQLGRSPLKDARTAIRNTAHAASGSKLEVPQAHPLRVALSSEHDVEDSKLPKRLASSEQDIGGSDEGGRAMKRARHPSKDESDRIEHMTDLLASSSLSLPSLHREHRPKQAAMPRAHSVPAQGPLPHLDFNQLPTSPSKPKGKQREVLRVASLPPSDNLADVAIITTSATDPDIAHPQETSNVDAGQRAKGGSTFQVNDTSPMLSSPVTPGVDLVDVSPMSPLTPLPQTPLPPRAVSVFPSRDSYQDIVVETKKEDAGYTSESLSRPSSRPRTPSTASRIPRPSSSLSTFEYAPISGSRSIAVTPKKGVVSRMKPRTSDPQASSSPTTTHWSLVDAPGSTKMPFSKTPTSTLRPMSGPSPFPRSKTPVATRSQGNMRRSRTPSLHEGRPGRSSSPKPLLRSRSASSGPQTQYSSSPIRPEPSQDPAIPGGHPHHQSHHIQSREMDVDFTAPADDSIPLPGSKETLAQPSISHPPSFEGLRRDGYATSQERDTSLPMRESPSKDKAQLRQASVPLIPLGGRMTRSASLRQKENKKNMEQAERTRRDREKAVNAVAAPAKTPLRGRSHSVSVVKPTLNSGTNSRPTSPTKSRRPVAATSSTATRPESSVGTSRAQSVGAHEQRPKALSTLSLALEKLHAPPPPRPNSSLGVPRPNTTLGFHRETKIGAEDRAAQRVSDDAETAIGSRDDNVRATIRSDTNNSVPASVPASAPSRSTVTPGPPSSIGRPVTQDKKRQSTLMLPPPPPLSRASIQRGDSTKSTTRTPITVQSGMVAGKGKSGFVFGSSRRAGSVQASGTLPSSVSLPAIPSDQGRVVHRASRKTSLPSVEGSPVKPSNRSDATTDVEMHEPSHSGSAEDLTTHPSGNAPTIGSASDLDGPIAGPSGARTDTTHEAHAHPSNQSSHCSQTWRSQSRRASQARHLLSQSISALPQTPPRKAQMSEGRGKGRAIVDRELDDAGIPRTAPAGLGGGAAIERRVSTRRAAAMAATALSPSSDHENKTSTEAGGSSAKTKTLKILRHCNIFVDVRTDDGDDAGGLFVEMLQGLGAKILARIGQSCTHIVYKNGLMSTLTRYRLLTDPKPHVVGIAWVVECIEQQQRVAETGFLVDLELTGVAGTNQRRRSMLPKHLMDSSATTPGLMLENTVKRPSLDTTSSPSSDGTGIDNSEEHLPPLERARRRRSALFT